MITLIEKGRERRESQGEELGSPFRVMDLARGVVQLGQDVRHVDHSSRRPAFLGSQASARIHMRDLVAGVKALIYRRNSQLDAAWPVNRKLLISEALGLPVSGAHALASSPSDQVTRIEKKTSGALRVLLGVAAGLGPRC